MYYTERIDGFQICDPTYLGDPPEGLPPTFDVVKWVQTEPQEVVNMRTGKKEISTEYCYVVAWLKWNAKEPCFEFQSCGLRWLGANPTQRVIDAILDFAERKEGELVAFSGR
ncbi:MAG: hypothetical protein J6W84_03395 [Bacteroidales bacterium]|nr:hypothetical protein [Bacteroidales bacterium]